MVKYGVIYIGSSKFQWYHLVKELWIDVSILICICYNRIAIEIKKITVSAITLLHY